METNGKLTTRSIVRCKKCGKEITVGDMMHERQSSLPYIGFYYCPCDDKNPCILDRGEGELVFMKSDSPLVEQVS